MDRVRQYETRVLLNQKYTLPCYSEVLGVIIVGSEVTGEIGDQASLCQEVLDSAWELLDFGAQEAWPLLFI